MSDKSEVDRVLAQYGQGYTAPQLNSGDGEIASTPDIMAQYGQQGGGLPGYMRALADKIKGWSVPNPNVPVNTLTGRERGLEARGGGNQVPLLAEAVGVHMPAGALETAANWLDWTPRVGQDTLAPLGLAAVTPLASGLRHPSIPTQSTPQRWERTYHGTADPEFTLQDRPIWSGNEQQARRFALEAGGPDDFGAVAPLLVDTSNYLTIRPNSVLQHLDNRFGSANELYRDGRNWVGDTAQAFGYPGVRYENLRRDRGPAVLSLDPSTVRSAFDPEGTVPHAPPRPRFDDDLFAENARGSLPGVVAQGLETSTSRPDADQILRQYSQGPQMSAPDTKGGGRGSGRGSGAGAWRPLDDAPAEEMVQARVRYRAEPHPEPWNDGTHIVGAQRQPDGTWVDRRGYQVWPIEWRPFAAKKD